MLSSLQLFLVIGFIVFALGILGGWMISKRELDYNKKDLQILIAVLVTTVWAMSILAEIIIPAYTVSVLIHGIMGAVVGYLFSDEVITLNLGQGK